jgi:hypothetical protein
MTTVNDIAREILGVDLDRDGPKLIRMATLKAALIAAKLAGQQDKPEKPKSEK